jgi:hypothetical protein
MATAMYKTSAHRPCQNKARIQVIVPAGTVKNSAHRPRVCATGAALFFVFGALLLRNDQKLRMFFYVLTKY